MTRKRVSQRNTSFGEMISCKVGERTESIIAMSSAKAEIFATCMAAMRMRSTATEQGIVSGVLELHVDANAATGIIGRQGLGRVRHLDLSCLWIQAAVRENNLPSGMYQRNNMADILTNSARRRLDHEAYGMSGKSSIRPTGFWGHLGRAEL